MPKHYLRFSGLINHETSTNWCAIDLFSLITTGRCWPIATRLLARLPSAFRRCSGNDEHEALTSHLTNGPPICSAPTVICQYPANELNGKQHANRKHPRSATASMAQDNTSYMQQRNNAVSLSHQMADFCRMRPA